MNKNQFTFQIALHTHQQVKLQIIKQHVDTWCARHKSQQQQQQQQQHPALDASKPEVIKVLPYSSPDAQYHVTKLQNHPDTIPTWISSHCRDPALWVRVAVVLKASH